MISIGTRLALMTMVLVIWSSQPRDVQGAGGHQHQHSAPVQEETPDVHFRITMEELHQMGGVPPGWQFSIPKGDPEAGRNVYIEMECYTCHRIAGERFPQVRPDERQPGPDLTGMGVHHPIDYFAEAIVNPNAVIVTDDPGYLGKDGLSIMPDYNDVLTVTQLIDLVAYLKSLRGGMEHAVKHTTEHTTGHGHKP